MAIARLPDTPLAPTFITSMSNITAITVQWVAGISPDIPVSGYRLYSDLGLNGDFFLIYDGSGNSNKLSFTHSNLESGLVYQYKVSVLNFNGESPQSPANSRAACDPPSQFTSV